jgi:hypothetical protein
MLTCASKCAGITHYFRHYAGNWDPAPGPPWPGARSGMWLAGRRVVFVPGGPGFMEMSLAGVVVAGGNGGTRDRRRLAHAPFTPSAAGGLDDQIAPGAGVRAGWLPGTATSEARSSCAEIVPVRAAQSARDGP